MYDLLVKAIGTTVQQYPYTVGALRLAHPNTIFPDVPPAEVLAAFDVYPVVRTDEPAYDPKTHRPEEAVPVFSAGQWMQAWTLRAATPQETAEATQEERRTELRNELSSTQPQQSLPGLVARIVKIEEVLGLRPLS